MYERTTKVDEVLRKLGIAIIVLGSVSGIVLLAMTAGSLGVVAVLTAFSSILPAIISGILLIGFAAIIRLLDQIRGQGEVMLKHLGEPPPPH